MCDLTGGSGELSAWRVCSCSPASHRVCAAREQGVFRRGMQLAALREFILLQGASRNVTVQEWDKIWAMNKKVVDPVCPRHTAVFTDRKARPPHHEMRASERPSTLQAAGSAAAQQQREESQGIMAGKDQGV